MRYSEEESLILKIIVLGLFVLYGKKIRVHREGERERESRCGLILMESS